MWSKIKSDLKLLPFYSVACMFSVYVFPFRGPRPKVCLLGTLNTEADKWRQKNKTNPSHKFFSFRDTVEFTLRIRSLSLLPPLFLSQRRAHTFTYNKTALCGHPSTLYIVNTAKGRSMKGMCNTL